MILQGFDHHFSAGHLFRHRLGFPFLVVFASSFRAWRSFGNKKLGNKKGPQGAFGQAPVAENGLCPVRRWRDKYEETVDQFLRPEAF
jgi:hypothetical protein